jgi:hypothetical protein
MNMDTVSPSQAAELYRTIKCAGAKRFRSGATSREGPRPAVHEHCECHNEANDRKDVGSLRFLHYRFLFTNSTSGLRYRMPCRFYPPLEA